MHADRRLTEDQQGWYNILQMQSHRLHRHLQQEVAKMHEEVKNVDRASRASTAGFSGSGAASSSAVVQCWKCGKRCHKLDVVQFVCHPEKRTQVKYEKDHKEVHVFCHHCLEILFRQQDKYLQKKKADATDGLSPEDRSDREQADFLIRLGAKKVRVLPCPECKTPNVLTQQTKFFETIERQKAIDSSGVMTSFTNNREATFKLVDNFVVEKVYENQRRPMLGSFSKDNLLITDWGGQFTDESQAQVLESISSPPNSAWFWIESYAADTARGEVDANGWEYASFSWNSKFSKRVSMFDFVRRRRLLHTRVRLSNEVKAMLAALAHIPVEQDEEDQRRERTMSLNVHSAKKKASGLGGTATNPSSQRAFSPRDEDDYA